MNHKGRVSRLEAQQPQPPEVNTRYTDEQWLASYKNLAEAIAEEASRAGTTAKDNPALALPLAIAEVLNNDKP